MKKILSKKRFTPSNSRGFTLIELMVVMAIIAVLAILVIGAIQAARRTSTATANRSNAKTVQTGLEAGYARYKSYCGAAGQAVTCTANATLAAVAAQLRTDGMLSPTAMSDSSNPAGSGGIFTALSATGYTISIYNYNGAVQTPAETITVP